MNTIAPVEGLAPSDALVAERRRKLQKFWPEWGVGRTALPDLLVDEPEFVQLQADRRACMAGMAREGEIGRELGERNRVARAKHEHGVRWALETGNPLPPAFVPEESPIAFRTTDWWNEKLASIHAAEAALMEELGTSLLKRLDARAAKLKAKVDQAERELAEAKAAHQPYVDAERVLLAVGESDQARAARLRREANEAPTSGPSIQLAYEDEDGEMVVETQKVTSSRRSLTGRR